MKPSLRTPRALLFDLDGTLVDSRRDIAEALNAALATLGRRPLDLPDVLPMIGDGARMLVVRALAYGGSAAPDAALVDRAAALYDEAYLAAPCVHTSVLPGARAALALGLPCAMVTNKPRKVAALVLEHLGLQRCFAATYAGGDGPLKPAGDGIVRVCDALGVMPSDTWMIGDGRQDVLAGKIAGAVTVAVAGGGIADEAAVLAAGPDVVLRSLEDLPARIARVSA